MRTAHEWFVLYGESHTNPVNKAIHWVCVPAIFTTTLGLLQAIPLRFEAIPWLHPAHLGVAIGLAFYATLSPTLFVGMALASALALAINHSIAAAGLPLAGVCAAVWIAAWIAQFVGHEIEGKKPSFFRDLQFLLVGPAWLLQFAFRKVGIPVGGT